MVASDEETECDSQMSISGQMHCNWCCTKQIVLVGHPPLFTATRQSLSPNSHKDLLKTVARCNWIGSGPMQFLWKPQITCFQLSLSSVCLFVCEFLFVFQKNVILCLFTVCRWEASACTKVRLGLEVRGNVRSYVSPTQAPAAARGRKAPLSWPLNPASTFSSCFHFM